MVAVSSGPDDPRRPEPAAGERDQRRGRTAPRLGARRTVLTLRQRIRILLVAGVFAAALTVAGVIAKSHERRDSAARARASGGGQPAAARLKGSGPLVVAAGDIACRAGDEPGPARCLQAATAQVAERLRPDAVLAVGDLQYERGSLEDFRTSFDRSWGRLGALLHPVPGNHEYNADGAAGYFTYFGSRAGRPGRGWYSFDLGTWHVIALNSNCDRVGGCDVTSPQGRWLHADLAAHRNRCTLAFWHDPRFSSGLHGDQEEAIPLWRAVYDARVDVVLGGNDHHYERFAPLSPSGRPDPRLGVRSFVVGTGGRSHYPTVGGHRGSEVRNSTAFGVLALRLLPDGFRWRFAPAAGATFTDSGSARCH